MTIDATDHCQLRVVYRKLKSRAYPRDTVAWIRVWQLAWHRIQATHSSQVYAKILWFGYAHGNLHGTVSKSHTQVSICPRATYPGPRLHLRPIEHERAGLQKRKSYIIHQMGILIIITLGFETCFAPLHKHLERGVLGCKTHLKSRLLAPF